MHCEYLLHNSNCHALNFVQSQQYIHLDKLRYRNQSNAIVAQCAFCIFMHILVCHYERTCHLGCYYNSKDTETMTLERAV